MSERRPFRDVKLQWLEQLSCDAGLSDSAKCIALHIITRYINGHTEEAWPSYKTIAEATGKSVKTIQRAIHDLEQGGWFDVVRGNGVGRSTRYRPSETSIIKACDAREKTDKIVTLHSSKGGQNCPKMRSKLSSKGRQNCPPNLENLNNKKLNAREEAPPPVDRRRAIPALFVASDDDYKLTPWRKWLEAHDLPEVETLELSTKKQGRKGFILPSYFPPSDSDLERVEACLSYFATRISRKNDAEAKLAFQPSCTTKVGDREDLHVSNFIQIHKLKRA